MVEKSVTTAPPPQIAAPRPEKPKIKQLTTPKPSTHKVVEVVESVKPPEKMVKDIVAKEVAEETIITPPAPITAAQLMMQTRASIASIQSNLDKKFEASAKRKREKFISARTQEKHYAAYMDAWTNKVQRFGNLNYPKEAHSKNMSGILRLDVALYPNGTIHSTKILKSSGYQILDNAALRIVRMSAPFSPFTKQMRKDVDILHITRTWEFSYKGLTTRK
jgi:protein TonB